MIHFCKLAAITVSIVCLCGCDGPIKKDITILKPEIIEPIEIPVSGGRDENVDENAPKEIKSEDLTYFDSWFANNESQELEWGKYFLKAELGEDGKVTGSYYYMDKNGDFTPLEFLFETDASFMKEINEIVKKSKIAAWNGYYGHTNGIPEDYGFAIDAKYASGERLYCSDNAANYYNEETMEALNALFYDRSGAKEYHNTDRLQNVYYSIYERDVYGFYAYIFEDPNGEVHYKVIENADGKGSWVPSKEGTVSQELLQKIQGIYEEQDFASIQTYPRREGDRHYSLYLMFGEDCEYIYSDTAISDEQYAALEGIRELILGETDI